MKTIVYLSSVDVYSQAELTTESTPTLPPSLYGLSKLYCERMVSLFAADKGMTCHVLRIGHVYGPGEEKFAKFLPKAIGNIVDGKPVELWGDGSEIRSFIYIDDVAKAIVKAADLRENVGVINVVGGVAVSIRQIVDRLQEISSKPFEIVVREFNGVKRNLVFDNTKLRKYLLPVESDLMSGLRSEYLHIESLR